MTTGVAMLFILLLLTMSIGVPIGVSLGVATVVTMLATTNINILSIPQNCIGGLDSFPLMAIPFFVLAGNLMRDGGISKKLLDFSTALVGFLTGGLGMVTTVACMFFAAISGSAPATVTAIGSTMIPAMGQKGYDIGYASALTAACGSIGVIIPPSIPFVIYGVVSGASIGGMFLAGLIPGILLTIVLMITNYIMAKKMNYGGDREQFKLKTLGVTFRNAFWALLIPVIILGGIYGGIFTPTEAAVVSVFYAVIVGAFVYKELTWATIYEALRDTVQINGSTTFMVGLSLSFAGYLTMAQIPMTIGNLIANITDSPILIMIMINVFLLIVGCFIDNISSTIILTPILLPIAVGIGIDPIHFGIILTINLAIGFVTPPYGVNLFFASAIGGISIEKISSKIVPFIIAMLIVLMLITYIAPLSMLLPDLLM